MSNKPIFNYNKLKPSVKKLFDECKKKYDLNEKDIIPTGKQKNHPYIGKDITLACSKKKTAKLDTKDKKIHLKTQKNKKQKSKSQSESLPKSKPKSESKQTLKKSLSKSKSPVKELIGYNVTLKIKPETDEIFNETISNMKIFKQWIEDENKLPSVKIKYKSFKNEKVTVLDEKTLEISFYVDNKKMDEVEIIIDSINGRSLDDDRKYPVFTDHVGNIYLEESNTPKYIPGNGPATLYDSSVSLKILNKTIDKVYNTKSKSPKNVTAKSSSKKIIGYNVEVKVTPEIQDKNSYPNILKYSQENMIQFKKWLEQNVNYIPMRGFKMENIKIEILNHSDLKISYFVASDDINEKKLIYDEIDNLQDEPMELNHDGSILFIPDPVGYKQSPKYLYGYGEVDSQSSQHIPLQMINLKRKKTLLKEDAVYK